MHDVLIIGAGPAGLAAALWCDELGLDTIVLEQHQQVGGQLHSIYGSIEDYPGLRAGNGQEFLERFTERITAADFDLWTSVEIASVDLKSKKVVLRSGEELQSISHHPGHGRETQKIGHSGEQEFARRGLIESAHKDSDQFTGKDVCVIGGGDAAAENALLLAGACPTVTLVHRRKTLRARPEFAQKLQGQHCITVFPESVVTRILGNDRVEAVEILRKGALKPFQMAVQAVMVRIGVEPNTDFFREQLQVDDQGYATVSSEYETSIANVFAIGDVSNPLAPTIIGAAGAGATAAKVIAARLNTRK